MHSFLRFDASVTDLRETDSEASQADVSHQEIRHDVKYIKELDQIV